MSSDTMSQPWPNDVYVIVAPRAGTEIVDPAEVVTHQHCHDCHAVLHCRRSVIRAASASPHRNGRMLSFLCVECATRNYDWSTIDLLVDRQPKPEGVA